MDEPVLGTSESCYFLDNSGTYINQTFLHQNSGMRVDCNLPLNKQASKDPEFSIRNLHVSTSKSDSKQFLLYRPSEDFLLVTPRKLLTGVQFVLLISWS